MDQVKEFLRLSVKYRFWIAVGISALLPMIGYFAGTGKIKAAATAGAAEIEGANKNVKEYASGTVPNGQYKQIVNTQTDALTTDINGAWAELYDRQAPLLTWPVDVAEKMDEWGRKWPETVDVGAVQLVINRYIVNYPGYVDEIYATHNPWEPMEGTGVVATPPKEILLQPVPFDETKPPMDLGKIWSAQERLWVQRALLEVVRKVNKNAKDWNSAVIKQILELDVATSKALDQISIATGETLVPPPEMVPAGGEVFVEDAGFADLSMGGFEESGMEGGYDDMGMGMPTGPEVGYLSSSNEQYQVVPINMAVLIDQNSINNLLVELSNSPMSILVVDYEQSRPPQRIQEPVKGQMIAAKVRVVVCRAASVAVTTMATLPAGGVVIVTRSTLA